MTNVLSLELMRKVQRQIRTFFRGLRSRKARRINREKGAVAFVTHQLKDLVRLDQKLILMGK
ncbi:MAG: hypothetical protein A3F04_00450 [Candidatus Chisholmbacteria bacterium RIFCSPHIGHO2_12_FULL_49_9]|nr:MAG: hypothetical protein A3F04_00450 [Candidatus Chisholmbacteria bacterium RIFCSPHIGHO2_12_FULL_49_9]